MPEKILSIEDARNYARKHVVSAKKSLKDSDFDESVTLLMEAAVMIVTPMKKEHGISVFIDPNALLSIRRCKHDLSG